MTFNAHAGNKRVMMNDMRTFKVFTEQTAFNGQ